MASNDLDSFIKNNKKFIKLADGESVIVEYVKTGITISRFNPEKEVVIYFLKPPGEDRALTWENSSIKVAQEFTKIKPGMLVKITRKGSTAKDTQYMIEPQVSF